MADEDTIVPIAPPIKWDGRAVLLVVSGLTAWDVYDWYVGKPITWFIVFILILCWVVQGLDAGMMFEHMFRRNGSVGKSLIATCVFIYRGLTLEDVEGYTQQIDEEGARRKQDRVRREEDAARRAEADARSQAALRESRDARIRLMATRLGCVGDEVERFLRTITVLGGTNPEAFIQSYEQAVGILNRCRGEIELRDAVLNHIMGGNPQQAVAHLARWERRSGILTSATAAGCRPQVVALLAQDKETDALAFIENARRIANQRIHFEQLRARVEAIDEEHQPEAAGFLAAAEAVVDGKARDFRIAAHRVEQYLTSLQVEA